MFQMESMKSVIASPQQGDFLTSLNIKDVYQHITIFPPHQKFQKISVENHDFQFVVLLFKPVQCFHSIHQGASLVLGLLHNWMAFSRGSSLLNFWNPMLLAQCRLWSDLDGP